jgi:predicted PurR-regulated permease PerM
VTKHPAGEQGGGAPGSPAGSPGGARAALAVLVGASVVLLGLVGLPIWRALLVAAVLAGTLGGAYEWAVKRLGGRRSLVATLFTLGTVLLVLLPIAALVLIAVREALAAVAVVRQTLESTGVEGLIARAPDPLEGWLRALQKHLPAQLEELRAQSSSGGKWALAQVTATFGMVANGAFQLVMMLIAYFFLLRDGPGLYEWLTHATPLPPARIRELMREFRNVSRSVVTANFVTGGVQALVATGGYFIARAPSPIFFGLLTLFASFIPSVGTSLVSLPLAGVLLLLGHPWSALFLTLWSLVVVGLIDNILRPYLIRGGSQLHGALVFFSLIGGIGAFGGIGLFLGPLVLTFFLTALRIAKKPVPPAPAA